MEGSQDPIRGLDETRQRGRTAVITGINGQDGSYLAEHLLSLGYNVIGIVRRTSSGSRVWRLAGILERIRLVEGDVTDVDSLSRIFQAYRPDEVYNLAAASFVGASFDNPYYVALVNAIGAVNVMTSAHRANHNVKIYQASSSEQFGNEPSPQNEYTKFAPRSPYGVSKTFAHQMAHVFRDSHQMKVWCGILFNHESPRRGEEFLSRKVSIYVAQYIAGRTDRRLHLGYLSSRRDWGYAGDYVKAMHLMLQKDKPCDYVIATGVSHSVMHLVHTAFACAGIEPTDLIEVDESQMRKNELLDLRGDAGAARRDLGWAPEIDFDHLVKLMVEAEIERTMRFARSRDAVK